MSYIELFQSVGFQCDIPNGSHHQFFYSKNPVIHMIDGKEDILKRRAYGGTMRLGAWKCKLASNTYTYNISYTKIMSDISLIISVRTINSVSIHSSHIT